MDSKKMVNKKFNFDSIRDKFRSLKEKISSNYLCVEFGFDFINIAEAYYSKNKVNFRKIIRKDLPPDALEKGLPSDPELMGNLIRNILIEENIFVKRVAILLSPDLVFSRLIEIPDKIKESKVYEFLRNPSSLIQIPIDIKQTEFIIRKTYYQNCHKKNTTNYFLSATPKNTIDTLEKTCKMAGIDLLFVDISFNANLKLFNLQTLLEKDKKNHFFILLDLISSCTYMTLMDENGPIFSTRISSIRDFPNKIGQISSNKSDEYLPISSLDIKVLVKEVKKALSIFFGDKKNSYLFKVILTGINSMHPNLVSTLSETIKLPTFLINPSGSSSIGDIKIKDDELMEANFSGIFGLGIELLDNSTKNKSNVASKHEFIEFKNPFKPKSLIKNKSIVTSKLENKDSEIQINKINEQEENKLKLNILKKDIDSNTNQEELPKEKKVMGEVDTINNTKKESKKREEDLNQTDLNFKMDTEFLE